MAILDVNALFSGSYASGVITGQSIIGTGNILGTNSYDTQAGLTLNTGGQNVDLGKGQDMDVQFDLTAAVAGGTSVEFQFVNADDAALGTNLTVLASSGAIPVASLGLGARVPMTVPKVDPRTLRRYVGVRYVIVGTTTAGAVSGGFTGFAGDYPQPLPKSGFAVL
jgi:hypothetical protein